MVQLVKSSVIVLALAFALSMFSTACAQQPNVTADTTIATLNKEKKIMKVEIWSDVMCPFCYIGKRKFEAALQQFAGKDDVVVEWKSYQLNPDMVTDTTKSTVDYLAESKGWTKEYTRETISYVVNMAKEVGLNYNFDKAVVANSFDAHRLIQLAKSKGKGDLMEERLFKAYFVEGKNTADHGTLTQLAVEIGLPEAEVTAVLNSDKFAAEVRRDVAESEQLGIRGVPFFVIDRKFGISGAQDSQVFLDSLNKAFAK